MLMVTLDHNCLIALVNSTPTGKLVREIVESGNYQCYVVNIGASEMLQRGITPDNYDKFEWLLAEAGVASLPRLDPMGLYGVTFYDRCVYADDEMVHLSKEIEAVLFGGAETRSTPPGQKVSRKRLNQLCDIHSLWCHIHYKNDVFLTSDRNFVKSKKLPKLLDLGAGDICSPEAFAGGQR